jgi:hypothetical protein
MGQIVGSVPQKNPLQIFSVQLTQPEAPKDIDTVAAARRFVGRM